MQKYFNSICFLMWSLSVLAQAPEHFQSNLPTEKKPWTNLQFLDNPDHFQFAIIGDRTGGHRPGVFAKAVEKLNILQPEFVMSVGDLIEGDSQTWEGLETEWSEFDSILSPLKMPFFHLPGNHDTGTSPTKRRFWEDKFGIRYYYFIYKDVLFLALESNEGQGERIEDEQLAYVKKVLEDHEDVRWTLLFMHHPLWDYSHNTNFEQVETMLANRKYTVIAGHQHTYRYFSRKDRNYYILATTGGGSSLRGPSYGQFDHITWVTVTENGPILANLMLDGILPHDITNTELVALSQNLVKSTSFEGVLLTPSADIFEGGILQVTVQNDAEHPLHLTGRFFHHHYVLASEGKVKLTVPPRKRSHFMVDLRVIEPFPISYQMAIDFDWSISYHLPEHPDLSLQGVLTVPLEASTVDIIPTRKAQFLSSTELVMVQPSKLGKIHYTLDGNAPTQSSPVYEKPIRIEKDQTVLAQIFDGQGNGTQPDTCIVTKIESGGGLRYHYFEYDPQKVGRWELLPNFNQLIPTVSGTTRNFDITAIEQREYFYGLLFEGKLKIDKSGNYTFYIHSDDGSKLLIDNELVVNNDQTHSARTEQASIRLKKGTYNLKVQYFQDRAGNVLEVHWEGPGFSKQPLDFEKLSF
ncbi:3',5'-cyclic AMP phosphodiesterase CpdA [Cyclobacterium xiamenense]|uniref:3',5'-cyclic AMP phosphodiesterase CpdA n=1 Tax=Cyclobacterium xiamenense TaxID=1297121 RepID=A0A1H6TVI4_9BACT|nr:3',5'-cyclic AMP phosphodiesterase CpdA [Cyclobacterium xiamenense]